MHYSIAHITDLHLDEENTLDNKVNACSNWLRILEDVQRRGIKRVIIGGDLGVVVSYPWLFTSLSDYKISITLGNHDQKKDVLPYFNPGSSSGDELLDYAMEDEDYKYIFWDSSSGLILNEQLYWLSEEIRTDKDILFFIHHPILPVDVAVDGKYALLSRDLLQKELEAIPRKVYVFCGHLHCDDIQTLGNISQYVTPAVSFQVAKLPDEIHISNERFGYRIIHLENRSMSTEVIYLPSLNGI